MVKVGSLPRSSHIFDFVVAGVCVVRNDPGGEQFASPSFKLIHLNACCGKLMTPTPSPNPLRPPFSCLTVSFDLTHAVGHLTYECLNVGPKTISDYANQVSPPAAMPLC